MHIVSNNQRVGLMSCCAGPRNETVQLYALSVKSFSFFCSIINIKCYIIVSPD